jgi:hypothetical protein
MWFEPMEARWSQRELWWTGIPVIFF